MWFTAIISIHVPSPCQINGNFEEEEVSKYSVTLDWTLEKRGPHMGGVKPCYSGQQISTADVIYNIAEFITFNSVFPLE